MKLALGDRNARTRGQFPRNSSGRCGKRVNLLLLAHSWIELPAPIVICCIGFSIWTRRSCNCDLTGQANQDNHVVLVDRRVKNPTLAKDEIRSVTAEFTPRVRLKHRNFTKTKLNSLISPTGKLLVRVTGLLMFDSKHFFHPDPPVKRDTDWEIHPILKVEYCPKGKTCRANSDENWRDLDE